MYLKSLIFFSLVCFFSNACKKEVEKKKVLVGEWECVSIVNKSTIIDNINNNPTKVRSDTIICSPSVTHITLNIYSVDTLSLYSVYNQNTQNSLYLTLERDKYITDGNKISFALNPLSLNDYTSTIKSLTNSAMILYDIDTTNASPLVINEVWYSFHK